MRNNTLPRLLITATITTALAVSALADETREKELRATMKQFSATTLVGGDGPDAYAGFLADDYSRWTLGADTVNAKQAWVDGMRGWYDDGWRVKERTRDEQELVLQGDYAFSRSVVTETYVGPEGDESSSTAALAETWVNRKGKWLLLRVDIAVVDN